jgi:hypothetical protein
MMEAEVLADNVVVIHQGELLESGTTSELKQKYGKDLHMHLGIKKGFTARDVLEKIGCKELRLESKHDMDRRNEEDTVLKLLLPSDTADVANVLTRVENLIDDNVLSNMGLQAVTLEDVFCNLDQKARGEKDQDKESELPTLQFKRDKHSTLRRFVALVTRRAASFWRSSVPLPYVVFVREYLFSSFLSCHSNYITRKINECGLESLTKSRTPTGTWKFALLSLLSWEYG